MFDISAELERASVQNPQQHFLRYRRDAITFGELPSHLDDLARGLPPLRQRRVVAILPDNLNSALLHLAAVRASATIACVSPFLTSAQIAGVLEMLQPDLICTTELLYRKHRRVLNGAFVALLSSEPGSKIEFAGVEKAGSDDGRPGPVRYVFFTSGTTGRPKGVCLSYNNITAAAEINRRIFSLGSQRRSVLTVPLYDYFGMIQLYSHLRSIATCTIGASGQFPAALFNTIAEHSITDIILVPFTLNACVQYICPRDSGTQARQIWRQLHYVSTSSDALRTEVLRTAFEFNPDLIIINVYGLTEAGRAVYKTIHSSDAYTGAIGIATPTMQAAVDAPAGQRGEIILRGPTVMLGYLSSADHHGITYDPVREIRTGDIGWVDAAGDINLVGRKDHIINLHGEKIHPAEIETPVRAIAGVQDAVARVVEDGNADKQIVMDIVLSVGAQLSKDAILTCLRDRVPRIFIPARINIVSTIARTEIGSKLVRQ